MVFIDGRREAYGHEDLRHTMTVGELIECLRQFDENEKVCLRNDNGYTYGSITEGSFDESETD